MNMQLKMEISFEIFSERMEIKPTFTIVRKNKKLHKKCQKIGQCWGNAYEISQSHFSKSGADPGFFKGG